MTRTAACILLLLLSCRIAANPRLLALDSISFAAFTPDGRLMTLSEADHQVHFYALDTGEEVTRLGGDVTGVVLSADGRRALAWGSDNAARVYDTTTGKALKRLTGAPEVIVAAALSPDGARALTIGPGDHALQLWDTTTGQPTAKLEGHTAPVTHVTISPDGLRAATAAVPAPAPFTATGPRDFSVRIWNLQPPSLLRKINLTAPARSIDYANNALLRVTTVTGDTLYDLSNGEVVNAPPTPDRAVTLRPAIGGATLVDAATGKDLRPLESPIDGLPLCHAFSPDCARVILGTGKAALFSRKPDAPGSVYLYDVATGRRLAQFAGHQREVTQVSLTRDAKHALSQDAAKHLLVWTLPPP